MVKWPSPSTGSQWSPGLLDRAETFAESDVEVSQNGALVRNEGIQIGNTSTTTQTADNSRTDLSTSGLLINPNDEINRLEVTLFGQNGYWGTDGPSAIDELRVVKHSDGTVVASKTVSADYGSVHEFSGLSLASGTDYRVVAYESGSVLDPSVNYGGSDSTTLFDTSYGIENGSTSQYWGVFSEIQAENNSKTSGSATITWPMPDDLAGWDIIPYQAEPDGGTIEVYAVDSNGNRLAGPLDDPGDISAISRSTNVGVEVVLERTDPSTQNPRVLSVYRRRKIT